MPVLSADGHRHLGFADTPGGPFVAAPDAQYFSLGMKRQAELRGGNTMIAFLAGICDVLTVERGIALKKKFPRGML